MRLDGYGLFVKDMTAMIRFYRDVLGFEIKEAEDTENVYKNDFEVTNDGTLDSILTVNVVVNRNDFSDDVIQYKIFNSDGEELNKGVVNGKGEIKLCDNLILEHDNTSKFTIVMWLKETGKLQNEEMRKVLTGTIKVDANQKID